MSSASERMSKVELGAVQNSLHPDKESSLQKMEEIILEKKNDYGKKLILKLTKVKDFELDNKYVNYFLLLIVSVSAAMFGVFLWYFLAGTCNPQTQIVQPYYSDSVYSSAFNDPQNGLHICQSFFEGSKQQCGQISAATTNPSMSITKKPSTAPTLKPTSDESFYYDDTNADDSKFCLIPCVFSGFNCEADYNTFNQNACGTATSTELTTFYGSLDKFTCDYASTVSCTYQAIPGTADPTQFFYKGAPASISVVYLSCNSVSQAILNAV